LIQWIKSALNGPYPSVFQRISEPVGIVAPVCQEPFRRWQAAQQGRGANVIADLACSHEEADRAAIGVRDGMQLGVQSALRTPDQTTALVIGAPFLARRLEAVRCTFR
jgi:hypothetical protein